MAARNRVGSCEVVLGSCLAACADQGQAVPGTPQAGAAVVPTPTMIGAVTRIDRSALTDVGTTQELDYGDPRMWLCRPGNDQMERAWWCLT